MGLPQMRRNAHLGQLFCDKISDKREKGKYNTMRNITKEIIRSFNKFLISEEKAEATVGKYLHDICEFQAWLGERELCKTAVLAYKSHLCEHYAPASVNAALSSLNCFFNFMELRVKSLKIQKQLFASADKESRQRAISISK